MNEIKQNSENLIAFLSDDLMRMTPMRHPLLRAVPWFIFMSLYVALIVSILGLRGDIDGKIQNPSYVFELFHVLSIAFSAALCVFWLCVPDMRGKRWMLAVPFSLLGIFIVQTLLRIAMETNDFSPLHWGECHRDAILFGFIPALALTFFSTKGRTVHPYLMSFMNAFSIGGLGYIGLRLTCASDDIGHLCGYHILPYLLFGMLIGLLAKRAYRW